MSKITNLTYSRTINLGNYESERLEATIELEQANGMKEGILEDEDNAFKGLRQWVQEQLLAKE